MVREIVAELKGAGGRIQDSGGESLELGVQGFELSISKSTEHETRNTVPIFVGVFVNESLEMVKHTLDFCNLDVAQLHGDETCTCCSQLRPPQKA